MIRICYSGAYRADGSRFKHACEVGDHEKAFCGVRAPGWVGARKKEDGFVLGDPANCPKCEGIVRGMK